MVGEDHASWNLRVDTGSSLEHASIPTSWVLTEPWFGGTEMAALAREPINKQGCGAGLSPVTPGCVPLGERDALGNTLPQPLPSPRRPPRRAPR